MVGGLGPAAAVVAGLGPAAAVVDGLGPAARLVADGLEACVLTGRSRATLSAPGATRWSAPRSLVLATACVTEIVH